MPDTPLPDQPYPAPTPAEPNPAPVRPPAPGETPVPEPIGVPPALPENAPPPSEPVSVPPTAPPRRTRVPVPTQKAARRRPRERVRLNPSGRIGLRQLQCSKDDLGSSSCDGGRDQSAVLLASLNAALQRPTEFAAPAPL